MRKSLVRLAARTLSNGFLVRSGGVGISPPATSSRCCCVTAALAFGGIGVGNNNNNNHRHPGAFLRNRRGSGSGAPLAASSRGPPSPADRRGFSTTSSAMAGTSAENANATVNDTEATTTTTASNSTNLWTVEECLDAWRSDPSGILFADATWFHKGNRTGRDEFEAGPRLPGASHFDVGELSASGDLFPDLNPSNLINVFPPGWLVGRALEAAIAARRGADDRSSSAVADDDDGNGKKKITLVVYGRRGTLFAPRVWYLLKKYASPDRFEVRLLQGSLESWIERGGPCESEPLVAGNNDNTLLRARDLVEAHRTATTASGDDDDDDHHPLVSPDARDRLVDKEFVLRLLERRRSSSAEEEEDDADDGELLPKPPRIVFDTRGSSFRRNGHIPGSVHVPYSSLCLPDDPSSLKPREELLEVLREALLSKEADDGGASTTSTTPSSSSSSLLEELRTRPPLLTCGSAVSVCTLALALDELGLPEPWIYDGSWNEWGSDPTTPKSLPLPATAAEEGTDGGGGD